MFISRSLGERQKTPSTTVIYTHLVYFLIEWHLHILVQRELIQHNVKILPHRLISAFVETNYQQS